MAIIVMLTCPGCNLDTLETLLIYMSLVMRKPAFCICENKEADQVPSNCAADQRLCFHYTDSNNPSTTLIRTFKPLTIFCGYTARFVSDLVGSPEDWFSHNEAHIVKLGFTVVFFPNFYSKTRDCVLIRTPLMRQF